MRGGTVRPGALLASPVLFGSIALLLLNDRVFKEAWPGVVTGKLSDVAGVAMVAILLTALLRRRGVAFGLTVVAFMVLKVVPVGAVWAAPVLGGVTRTDPTDLVALLALVPLWRWIGDRSGRVTSESSSPTTRLPSRVWVLPVQILAIGTAMFATSASGCDPSGVSSVTVDGDRVLAVVDLEPLESLDFGRTWGVVSDSEGMWSGPQQACISDEPCVTATHVGNTGDDGARPEIVIRRVEGDQTTDLLSITSDQLAQIEALMPTETCGAVEAYDGVIIDSPQGEHVLAPMGTAGLLHQTPDGAWQWVAVGRFGFEPDEVADEPLGVAVASTADAVPFAWGRWVARSLPLAVILGTALMAIPLGRLARRNQREAASARWSVVGLVAGQVAVGLVAWNALPTDEADGFTELASIAIAFGLAVVAVFGLTYIAGRFGRQSPGPLLRAPEPSDRLG